MDGRLPPARADGGRPPQPRRRSSRSCTTTTPSTSPSAPLTIPKAAPSCSPAATASPATGSRSTSTATPTGGRASPSRSACPAPAGDEFISQDGNRWDANWDPIWEGATAVDGEGWTAEMRIPLSQLRFSSADGADLGPPGAAPDLPPGGALDLAGHPQGTAPGWVSQFGELRGIRGPEARGRAGSCCPTWWPRRSASSEEAGNPFRDGGRRGHLGRGGRKARPHHQPHRGLHPEPGLRPGGGRPLGGEPHRLRDLLRGEAAVLHRGQPTSSRCASRP